MCIPSRSRILSTHAHPAGVYVVLARGPCSLPYVGQQSHTRRYSCVTNACIRRARVRAKEPFVVAPAATVHAHTETESAANALTYDGLLLRKAARRGRRAQKPCKLIRVELSSFALLRYILYDVCAKFYDYLCFSVSGRLLVMISN